MATNVYFDREEEQRVARPYTREEALTMCFIQSLGNQGGGSNEATVEKMCEKFPQVIKITAYGNAHVCTEAHINIKNIELVAVHLLEHFKEDKEIEYLKEVIAGGEPKKYRNWHSYQLGEKVSLYDLAAEYFGTHKGMQIY